MHSFKLHSLADTEKLAKVLANKMIEGTALLLSGDLGSGKTTFTQYLGRHLGVKRHMTSPTFNIIKTYNGKVKIHHMDCYRLEHSDEDLGFDEYFNETDITVVEWPQFIAEFLPEEVIDMKIKYIDADERLVTIEGTGKKNAEIVREVYDKFTV